MSASYRRKRLKYSFEIDSPNAGAEADIARQQMSNRDITVFFWGSITSSLLIVIVIRTFKNVRFTVAAPVKAGDCKSAANQVSVA